MLQTFISFINKIRDWETIMLYPLNKCDLYITFIKFKTVLYGYQRLVSRYHIYSPVRACRLIVLIGISFIDF